MAEQVQQGSSCISEEGPQGIIGSVGHKAVATGYARTNATSSSGSRPVRPSLAAAVLPS